MGADTAERRTFVQPRGAPLASANGIDDHVAAPLTPPISAPRPARSGDSLPTGLPHLRLRTAIAMAFAIAVSLPALPALAKGRRPACAAHGHALHAHCTAHGHRARHTSASKRSHTVHSIVVTRRAAPLVPARATAPGATCEDGSAPVSGARGSPACADGSQPSCADGSQPADGACPASTEAEPDGGEPACEDASGTCDPTEEDASQCHEGSVASPGGEGPGFVCEG